MKPINPRNIGEHNRRAEYEARREVLARPSFTLSYRTALARAIKYRRAVQRAGGGL
jgi:hypothetical protein